MRTNLRNILLCAVLAVAASACGGDDDAAGGASNGGGGSSDSGSDCSSVDLATAPDEPVELRLGHSPVTEEPFYLQFADPEAAGAEHEGAWYTIAPTQYDATDRLAAYQSGAIDGGTISTAQLFSVAAAGIDITAVASVNRVTEESGASVPYLSLDDSGIESPADLEGARVGIIAPRTITEYAVLSVASKEGLDPRRDIELVNVAPPTAEQALRTGQVDVAFVTGDFLLPIRETGGVQEVFNAWTGPGFDYENIVVFFEPSFIDENLGAVCAYLEDLQASTATYLDDRAAAGEILIENELDFASSVDAFVERPDLGRSPDATMQVESMQLLIDDMTEVGFLEEGTPAADTLVRPGVSLVE